MHKPGMEEIVRR